MARTPLIAFVVVTLLLALAPALALAAPPANDDFANRTVIPSLPYTDTLDMTEATADPTDPIYCGGPDVATVWYEFTAPADLFVTATTDGSDFLAGINVLIGDPSDPANLGFVTCGLPSVGFFAETGTTYYLMVTPYDASTAPGMLVLTAEEAPPPPELDLALDPVGSVDRRPARRRSAGRSPARPPLALTSTSTSASASVASTSRALATPSSSVTARRRSASSSAPRTACSPAARPTCRRSPSPARSSARSTTPSPPSVSPDGASDAPASTIDQHGTAEGPHPPPFSRPPTGSRRGAV